MKTFVPVAADVRTLCNPGMKAAGITQITRVYDPDTGEIGVETLDSES
jgi:hypothetical protein